MHKHQRNQADRGEGEPRMPTTQTFRSKQVCHQKMSNRRRHEKDGDIDPVGRWADCAVVGVKQYGNQSKPNHDPHKLHIPEIFTPRGETTFNQREDEHREK